MKMNNDNLRATTHSKSIFLSHRSFFLTVILLATTYLLIFGQPIPFTDVRYCIGFPGKLMSKFDLSNQLSERLLYEVKKHKDEDAYGSFKSELTQLIQKQNQCSSMKSFAACSKIQIQTPDGMATLSYGSESKWILPEFVIEVVGSIRSSSGRPPPSMIIRTEKPGCFTNGYIGSSSVKLQ